MTRKETAEERKKRFIAMTSAERKLLIRLKMKQNGIEEGSGVLGATYDEDELWDLIRITSCFSEMKNRNRKTHSNLLKKNKLFLGSIMIVIAFSVGTGFYIENFPLPATRREISVEAIFLD
mgnify:CR=1 FL=1